jgi:hypothetical protein
MLPKRRTLRILRWAMPLVACIIIGAARGQNVILHLRNGDRIAGTILSENTNQVTLSNAWTSALSVPLAQIESREIPAPKTNAAPATAVSAAKPAPAATPTNAVDATLRPVKLLAVPAPPPKTNPSWFKRHIKGDASVGSDLLFGSADREIYFGRFSLTYSQPYQSDPKEFFRDILSYNAEYGKTAGVLSANHMEGSSKTDFDLSRKVYAYNLGGAGYDEIRKIDLHYEIGPGVGWHALTFTNFVLNFETGGNYQRDDRSDNTVTKNFYYRLAEDYTWKINHSMNMKEKFEFFPQAENLGQYRARFESTLSYALLLHLSLDLTVLDTYDTQPAAGVDRNELQIRTSLGVKF